MKRLLLVALLTGCDDLCLKHQMVNVDMASPCARECYLRALVIEHPRRREVAQRECFIALCGATRVCP